MSEHLVPHVAYADIPRRVRDVADETYTPEGVEIWFNARNRILNGKAPRDMADQGYALANALADGVFV